MMSCVRYVPTIHTLVYANSKPDLKSASFKICGAWLPLSKKRKVVLKANAAFKTCSERNSSRIISCAMPARKGNGFGTTNKTPLWRPNAQLQRVLEKNVVDQVFESQLKLWIRESRLSLG